jgi:hypothetical protein
VIISAGIQNIIKGEIMNTDNVIELKGNEAESMGGFVKLYAHGKIGLLFNGPEEYRSVAEECFKHALEVQITVDDIAFVRTMRDRGTPEAAINEFLNSCSVFDEVHLGGLSLH